MNVGAELTAWGVTRSATPMSPIPDKQSVESLWSALTQTGSTVSWQRFQEVWETRFHNPVHVFVGGDMNSGRSPKDPLFWMHHAFVDKLWADLQSVNPTNAVHQPTNLSESIMPQPPFTKTVQGLLDTVSGCNYTYQELFRLVAGPVPPPPALTA